MGLFSSLLLTFILKLYFVRRSGVWFLMPLVSSPSGTSRTSIELYLSEKIWSGSNGLAMVAIMGSELEVGVIEQWRLED